MKKIIIFFTVILPALAIWGCRKEELMTYKGSESIYFEIKRGDSWSSWAYYPYYDYTRISLLMEKEDTYQFDFLITTTGPVKNYDRPFSIAVVAESTTAIAGQEYTIGLDHVIKAGENSVRIPVSVTKSERMQDEEVSICIQLLDNEHFDLSFSVFDQPKDLATGGGDFKSTFDNTRHTFYVDDIVSKPPNWLGSAPEWNNFYEYNTFGVFSREKFEVIRSVTGTDIEIWWDTDYMTYGRERYYAPRVAAYLVEQYKISKESVILEKDGRLMWIQGVPWLSKEGVAWDPNNWPNDVQ